MTEQEKRQLRKQRQKENKRVDRIGLRDACGVPDPTGMTAINNILFETKAVGL